MGLTTMTGHIVPELRKWNRIATITNAERVAQTHKTCTEAEKSIGDEVGYLDLYVLKQLITFARPHAPRLSQRM
jgi:uncharacterized Ntn-hydrolase superfamily protein